MVVTEGCLLPIPELGTSFNSNTIISLVAGVVIAATKEVGVSVMSTTDTTENKGAKLLYK